MTAGGEMMLDGAGRSTRPSVRAYASAMTSLPRHIVITGLMGSGKTTVGRALAHTLGRTWRDSDAEIEADTGLTVRELRDREGVDEDARARGGAAPRRPRQPRTQRHQRSRQRRRFEGVPRRDGRAGRRGRLAARLTRGPGRPVRLRRRPPTRLRHVDQGVPGGPGRRPRAARCRDRRPVRRRRRPVQDRS